MTRGGRRSRVAGLVVGAALAGGAVLVACAGDPAATPPATVPPTSAAPTVDIAELGGAEPYAAQLFEATNAARAAEGLEPLAGSACAQEQGGLRAAALVASGGELVHAPMGPVASACVSRSTTGENLSRAAVAPDDVVDAWMGSPGHRSNILDPAFTEMGISCAVIPAEPVDEALCSQVFLGP